ncbi:MAG: hypothetical protein QW128_02490 [Thermoprotei archaeon]
MSEKLYTIIISLHGMDTRQYLLRLMGHLRPAPNAGIIIKT